MLHNKKVTLEVADNKSFGRNASEASTNTANYKICSDCKGNGYKFAVLDFTNFRNSKIDSCPSCKGSGEIKENLSKLN
jgi:DnaJ-class molecular chaperone